MPYVHFIGYEGREHTHSSPLGFATGVDAVSKRVLLYECTQNVMFLAIKTPCLQGLNKIVGKEIRGAYI